MGFPLDRTALLVIDPVNDFLSEGGAGYDLTKNTLKLHDVVGNLRLAIDGAREKAAGSASEKTVRLTVAFGA